MNIYIYVLIINIISLIMYGIDKLFAIKKLYRIPERFLILLDYLGGFIGSFIGMYLFHHKTKKHYFLIHIILSLIIWGYIYIKFFLK